MFDTPPSTGPAVGDATGPEHDLRQLPCPQPLHRALDLAEALAPGQGVQVLTPLQPLPLLDMLEGLGFRTRVCALPEGGTRVWIWRDANDAAADH